MAVLLGWREEGREKKEKVTRERRAGTTFPKYGEKWRKRAAEKKGREKKGDFFRDFSFLPVSKETSSLLDFPFEEKSLEESSANGGNFLCESAVRPIWVGLPVAVTPLPAR